jgi:SAP domain-containing new25/Domain of unknown function (DUF6434)
VTSARKSRPELTVTLTGAELLRWYWLKSELISFARVLDVATSGSKEELTTRVAAVLDGHAPPSRKRDPGGAAGQLVGDLSASTIIPPGQRSSQELRGWFRDHVGPSFRFDRHMREFIKSADGTTTLSDAVKHWNLTRSGPAIEIDPQFEFNRFTRAWHAANPSGNRAELLEDWKHYRSLPIDERDRA